MTLFTSISKQEWIDFLLTGLDVAAIAKESGFENEADFRAALSTVVDAQEKATTVTNGVRAVNTTQLITYIDLLWAHVCFTCLLAEKDPTDIREHIEALMRNKQGALANRFASVPKPIKGEMH